MQNAQVGSKSVKTTERGKTNKQISSFHFYGTPKQESPAAESRSGYIHVIRDKIDKVRGHGTFRPCAESPLMPIAH